MTPLAGVWPPDSRQQPTETGIVCEFDGRLDSAAPPSAAAIDAYRRRGVAGFRELVGDWSLALRDYGSRTLILASDYAGVRPLYYTFDGRRALWSSTLGGLIRAAGATELDDAYIASFLSRRPAAGRTPYRGIRSVPPGHAIRIQGGRETVERFWDLPVDQETRLADDRAYQERLLELFREAVETRVRGHAVVCAELSGGLDSSSVVAMASRVHPRVTTISYTHPGAADESFIQTVESEFGLPAEHLDVGEYPYASPAETGNAAPSWWAPRFRGLAERLAALGAGAILTGQLGDLAMGNTFDDSDQVAGFLRRFELRNAGREAYRWSRALRVPIYPILWRAMRLSLSSWTPEPTADLTPTSGLPRFEATSLTARLSGMAAETAAEPHEYNWRAAAPDRRRRFRAMASMLATRRLQTPEALRRFSFTHPFAHRPLVEFILTIPPAQLCGPGEPRRLMRRAFQGLLPAAVLRRRSKASFGDVFDRAFLPMAASLQEQPDRLLTIEFGYVDRAGLLDRLERYAQGLDCNSGQLRAIILLEYWLRSRQG
jgi:asparagine synthase (glutamine-hydrolysing)